MYTIAVIVVLYFYVRLGMWVARKAASRWERKRIKWGVRIAVALAFILIPTGDWIAGRIYFNHLCETEAGVKVYQTIELPDEYWNEDGTPKFYDENNGHFTLPAEKFYTVESKTINHLFGIKEHRAFILDINTHKIIGEKPRFQYWGGYILGNLPPNNVSIGCGSNWSEFVKKQFTQTAKRRE